MIRVCRLVFHRRGTLKGWGSLKLLVDAEGRRGALGSTVARGRAVTRAGYWYFVIGDDESLSSRLSPSSDTERLAQPKVASAVGMEAARTLFDGLERKDRDRHSESKLFSDYLEGVPNKSLGLISLY